METGIYDDIPEETYHKGPEASVSRLKLFAVAPAKARFAPPRKTRALGLGKLVHTAILEPHALEQRFYPVDLPRIHPNDGATKAAIAAAGMRQVVHQRDYDAARRAGDAVMKWSPALRELFDSEIRTEQSFYWTCPVTGVKCRGRVDAAHPRYRTMIDLKSASNASAEAFMWTIHEYAYHWQQAMYQDGWVAAGGWVPSRFVFVAVELEEPYLTGVYELSQRAVELGRDRVEQYLAEWRRCEEAGVWPGLPAEQPISLDLPTKAYLE